MILHNGEFDFEKGEIILINKEIGWTSFDVVKKVKNLVIKRTGNKKIKVGHAGTLDPLAKGLIIICTGKETKNVSYYQDKPKEYLAKLELGKTTLSYDLETEVNKVFATSHITNELISEVINDFKGLQMQEPPLYSAKWINGKRAYEYARKGEKRKLYPAQIEIYEIEIVNFKLPVLLLRILCSKGTYIRSLARDIGFALQSGAYLAELNRTKIGKYKLENAKTIKEFEELVRL